MFDIDLSFTGILIFRQQVLNIRGDGRGRWEENCDAHLALQCAQETFRFI